jgi:hypothetical protein
MMLTKEQYLSLNVRDSIFLYDDSARAKLIESLIATIFTPVPMGDNDIADFYIGYQSLTDFNFTKACDVLGYTLQEGVLGKPKYNCMSMGNGFSVEVKCSNGKAFDIKKRSGHIIPSCSEAIGDSDERITASSYAFNDFSRPADFYLLIDICTDEEAVRLHKHPLQLVKGFHLIPTCELEVLTGDFEKQKGSQKTIAKAKVAEHFNHDYRLRLPLFPIPVNPKIIKNAGYLQLCRISINLQHMISKAFEKSGDKIVERKKDLDNKKEGVKLGSRTKSWI